MDIGIIVPQGWTGEYDGWDAAKAWARSLEVARKAEAMGFESLWVFDHFQTVPEPTDELTFESFTVLSALATVTQRVRLGHVVICTAYRNPALTAKMIATLDVISGGRAVLGIGAGWKEDEFRAYGYGYPDTKTRLATLRDHLEIITRMLAPGRATFDGTYAHVHDAINLPKGVQSPRVPIMIGGNGPNVTWRLAARFADELNLDGLSPAEVRAAKPVIARRCEEIGRDPASLRLSMNIWRETLEIGGRPRIDLLGALREAGLDRVMGLLGPVVDGDEAFGSLVVDARAAGISFAGA